jgi:glycosyltransferase involved in cell wall biosynthesis
VHYGLKAAICDCLHIRRNRTPFELPRLPKTSDDPLPLSEVVYTSIFNPDDSRKNWEDLLTAFLIAMKDCDDATLVLKLISCNRRAVDWVWNFYHRTGIAHRCKVVFVPDFLSDSQLLELAEATTYYITTTRAEGNCLPLMNYLAAGRPGISPRHTAIADYFGPEVGFVVESHPEPAAFPHDGQLRKTTSWHRLVWPSLAEAIRKSYDLAKNDFAAYEQLAHCARERMLRWSSMKAVAPRMHHALNLATRRIDQCEAKRG